MDEDGKLDYDGVVEVLPDEMKAPLKKVIDECSPKLGTVFRYVKN